MTTRHTPDIRCGGGVSPRLMIPPCDVQHAVCVRVRVAQVVVNLYPFRATVTRSPPPPFEEGVENIDIGGPAMIRAAAKNHGDVTVIVDPADYPELLAQLSSAEGVSQEFRKKMAWKAYQHTASYDAQVCPGKDLVRSVFESMYCAALATSWRWS